MSLYKMAEKQVIKDKHLIKLFLGKVSVFENYITNIMMEVTFHSCILYYNTIVLLFKLIHNYFDVYILWSI